ncbi:MAG: hypothetical protein R2730_14555 [Chitinophagales bacterium]
MKITIYILLFSICIYACRPNSNKVDSNEELSSSESNSAFIKSYYDEVFLPELDDIFRAVNFDDQIDVVKSAEANYDLDLTDESDGYLQYEKDIFVDTAKGIDYIMVKYIFDSYDRLWVVTLNYIIQDSIKTTELFDHLNTTFNDKYGDYYFDRDGFTVWESSYKRSDSVEVVYDLGVRKLLKFDDPGIQIELMRFGQL